jgi:ribonuclease HII
MARERIAGVDEAGRGCLAGPVVAAAVILRAPIEGLQDSKTLTPRRRAELAARIRAQSLGWSIGAASREEIDRLNILQATLLAMRRAVSGLGVAVTLVRVDGNQDPGLGQATVCVVDGDALHPEIMAASILAKTVRDTLMAEVERRHPGYGFDRHMGYGTRAHLAAMQRLGLCPEHRRSFAPCARLLGPRAADA